MESDTSTELYIIDEVKSVIYQYNLVYYISLTVGFWG